MVQLSTHSRTPRRPGVLVWLCVLLITGLVQLIRAQWFDAFFFLAGAGVLALTALQTQRHTPSQQQTPSPSQQQTASQQHKPSTRTAQFRTRILTAWLWPLTLAGTLITALLPRHSPFMQIWLIALCLSVVVLAWPNHQPSVSKWPPNVRLLGWMWGTILVCGALWELWLFLQGKLHPDQPAFALSDLVDPLLSNSIGQFLFALLWVCTGALLLRRGMR